MNASTDLTTPAALRPRPDLGDGVALLDLEDRPCPARRRVVLGAGELVLDAVRCPCQTPKAATSATTSRTTATGMQPIPERSRRRRAGVVLLHRRLLESTALASAPGVRLPAYGARRRLRRGARMPATGGLLRVVLSHPRPRRSLLAPLPVARSVSSACCRISTAAAWSTTARRSCPCDPGRAASPPRTPWSAARRPAAPAPGQLARQPAGELAHLDRGRAPRRPDSERGSPTTTSTASSSASSAADPGQVAVARARPSRPGSRGSPDGSLRATPIRASPGSMPSRTPCRNVRPDRPGGPTSARHQGQRLVDPGRVGAAALGDVVLAAALAADQRADRADQRVGADSPRPRRLVVDRGHDRDLAVGWRR